MSAPINVKLQSPTISITDWPQREQEWKQLNTDENGNPYFFPITIKFAYVLGVIHDICDSVNLLLSNKSFARSVGYIPACGIFASGIELLGRCVSGEIDYKKPCLTQGLQWLAKPDFAAYSSVPNSQTLVNTSTQGYTIDNLRGLRNFAAHGQAASSFYQIDFELLEGLRPLLRDALETYWSVLASSDDACNNLAKANVVALRGWPVLKTWLLFQGDATTGNQSITGIFDHFKWGNL